MFEIVYWDTPGLLVFFTVAVTWLLSLHWTEIIFNVLPLLRSNEQLQGSGSTGGPNPPIPRHLPPTPAWSSAQTVERAALRWALRSTNTNYCVLTLQINPAKSCPETAPISVEFSLRLGWNWGFLSPVINHHDCGFIPQVFSVITWFQKTATQKHNTSLVGFQVVWMWL